AGLLTSVDSTAVGSGVAALTLWQWKASVACRLCRSGPSKMTMLEIGLMILIRVRKIPSCIGELVRRFLMGVAPQSLEAGVGRDILPLPVRKPASLIAGERYMILRALLSSKGSLVRTTKWTPTVGRQAQNMAVQTWTCLNVMGLNYLHLGHLSTNRWEAVGRFSEAPAASLRVIGETIDWHVGDALAQDCRALALKFGELEPSLPKAKDIGRMDVLDYVKPELVELPTKP
ncbi:unnamed protein product, partial [Prorocentrum cordatum]